MFFSQDDDEDEEDFDPDEVSDADDKVIEGEEVSDDDEDEDGLEDGGEISYKIGEHTKEGGGRMYIHANRLRKSDM